MCGIAGIVGVAPDPTVIERMVERLHHRGPDDHGIWRSEDAQLGHARLAILDLSAAGHQPMVRDQLVISYNGEAYNFRELRRQLPGPFRSDCDTEVVLAAYAELGDRCLHRLRGMFAFACGTPAVTGCSRPRPARHQALYYRPLPASPASEIRLSRARRPPVDVSALRDYLTYRYIGGRSSRNRPAASTPWPGKARARSRSPAGGSRRPR
jgi:asparagine synthase (glutamine-hydrolysing)